MTSLSYDTNHQQVVDTFADKMRAGVNYYWGWVYILLGHWVFILLLGHWSLVFAWLAIASHHLLSRLWIFFQTKWVEDGFIYRDTKHILPPPTHLRFFVVCQPVCLVCPHTKHRFIYIKISIGSGVHQTGNNTKQVVLACCIKKWQHWELHEECPHLISAIWEFCPTIF